MNIQTSVLSLPHTHAHTRMHDYQRKWRSVLGEQTLIYVLLTVSNQLQRVYRAFNRFFFKKKKTFFIFNSGLKPRVQFTLTVFKTITFETFYSMCKNVTPLFTFFVQIQEVDHVTQKVLSLCTKHVIQPFRMSWKQRFTTLMTIWSKKLTLFRFLTSNIWAATRHKYPKQKNHRQWFTVWEEIKKRITVPHSHY